MAAVIVTSNSQVARDTISGHKPPSGKHPNILAGSINGKDIADRSGVETCKAPLVKKFGPICAGSDGVVRSWENSLTQCASLGLRLPTISEAITLAKKYDVPGVSGTDFFWADSEFVNTNFKAALVDENANLAETDQTTSHQAVCVTDPSA
jgi:hypothetical protein